MRNSPEDNEIERLRERCEALEDLLRSAHCIALRKGQDTAWERFAYSIKQMGIGSITARVYKLLPGIDYPDHYDLKRMEAALDSPITVMPSGLGREEKRRFLMGK